ncbi:MAG: hypothetical protein ACE5GI_02185 [Candidatus Aminicenantales bacterium]
MLNSNRLNLNLASRPLRNRKLFYWSFAGLGIVFIILIFLSLSLFVSYKSKSGTVKASIRELEESLQKVKAKEKQYNTRLENMIKDYKEIVDEVNGIIYRKSFSWVDFLTSLEKSLPDSSYIISLAPTFNEDLTMKVRLKVISRELNDLLSLINNLEALKFKKIKVLNETKNEQGLLLYEVSLSYERII